jgi:hypothetical protein
MTVQIRHADQGRQDAMTWATDGIPRRRTLALLAAAAVTGLKGGRAYALPAPQGGLSFSVWRNGSEIGSHTVDFERSGERMIVRSAADFVVRFGPIVLYRYSYRATETWQGDTLQAVSAHTDDDGEAKFAEMRLEDGRLVVTGSRASRYVAPPGSIAATHWNPAELTQPMINPQNGELMRFERHDFGQEQLSPAVIARHVGLSGYATLDLWYDQSDRWCALRAIASDGSVIDYHLR